MSQNICKATMYFYKHHEGTVNSKTYIKALSVYKIIVIRNGNTGRIVDIFA